MALRVLLADESSTIKKVMQLALQDFAVEVKTVSNGLDALTVARSFSPDIAFFDVLLAKKSGYDACSEMKNDPGLSRIPAVLMWSGFMDFDDAKAQEAKAEAKLEKPFDADALRSIVKKLVPKLNENVLSNYLSFPELPEIVDAPADAEEPEEFQQVPLPKLSPTPNAQSFDKKPEAESWTVANLDRFKLNIPSEEIPSPSNEPPPDYTATRIALSSGSADISLEDLDVPVASMPAPSRPTTSESSILPEVAEQIMREQVRSVLQDIAWKILPDITERIVREEINKLLKEAEKLSPK